MIRKQIKQQIEDCAGNVQYTFSAHWIMVNRYKMINTFIKMASIVLTAFATGGFLTSVLAVKPFLSWMGGLSSAIALALNLYTYYFDLPGLIDKHTNAANELWVVREGYKSLLVDFDELDIEIIREKRDYYSTLVDSINKNYPGTDERSFKKAQKDKDKYKFNDNEVKELLHL